MVVLLGVEIVYANWLPDASILLHNYSSDITINNFLKKENTEAHQIFLHIIKFLWSFPKYNHCNSMPSSSLNISISMSDTICWSRSFLLGSLVVKIHTKPRAVFTSVQFSLIAQSCPTLCNPMNCSTPGLPVHHQLPEFQLQHQTFQWTPRTDLL